MPASGLTIDGHLLGLINPTVRAREISYDVDYSYDADVCLADPCSSSVNIPRSFQLRLLNSVF